MFESCAYLLLATKGAANVARTILFLRHSRWNKTSAFVHVDGRRGRGAKLTSCCRGTRRA
jgi:hypothetical protein